MGFLFVNRFPVSHLYDEHNELPFVDFVYDSVNSHTDPEQCFVYQFL